MSGSSLNKFLRSLKTAESLLVTPRLEKWLIAHPEFPEPTDADLILIRRLLGARGSRVGTFTGSQAGSCEREQMFRFLGVPGLRRVDPDLQKRFLDGTFRHIRWQLMVSKAIPGVDVEVPVVAPSSRFRGALDGVHPEERWGFELKGTSQFNRVMDHGVFDAHQQQATRYWLATDEDPSFPELTKWSFIYENKLTQEHREMVVTRDPKVEQAVRSELNRLNRAAENHELPPILPECRQATGPVFRNCPFSAICLRTHTWKKAEALVPQDQNKDSPAAAGGGTEPTQQPAPARSQVARQPGKKSQGPGKRDQRLL